jgi:hypothetical protein
VTRQVFLAGENESDSRALCFAAVLGGRVDEIRRTGDLGDAFAQAVMARQTIEDKRFQWAENLLPKENAIVSTGVDIAINVELDAGKTWKEQRRTFWLPLSLAKWAR